MHSFELFLSFNALTGISPTMKNVLRWFQSWNLQGRNNGRVDLL